MARDGWRTVLVAIATVICVLSVAPGFATAEILAPDEVYSVTPENTWGVSGLDEGSGNFQYYSPIFALEQIGESIFAGGKFLQTTNGASSASQPYLAAFDAQTGAWKPLFRPRLDWSVFDLATDGERLFAGGEFTTANGELAPGVVTLNPITGATDTGFGIQVSSANPSLTRIHTLEIDRDWLYLGGWFTSITGPNGVARKVSHVARISLTTGAVDGGWKPRVRGGAVWEIEPDENNGRVLLGGPFDSIDGFASKAFAVVDDVDGDLHHPSRKIGSTYFDEPGIDYDFVSTIEVDGDRVVMGGQQHRLLIMDNNFNVIEAYTTDRHGANNGGVGGDIQDIVISDGTAFVSCHCWGRVLRQDANLAPIGDPLDVRSAFAVDLPSGLIDRSFQPDFSGSAGPWALLVDSRRCLWLGTDAHQVGQKLGRGLVKFCPHDDLTKSPLASLTLSSTSEGDPRFGVSFAVDGDRITNFPAASGSARTQLETAPHLDIDLGLDAFVESVIIWNRTDGGSHTENLRVLGVSTSNHTQNWTQDRNNPNVHEALVAGDHSGKRTLTVPINSKVRYLRLETDYSGTGIKGFLDLIEVSVIEGIEVTGDGSPRLTSRTFHFEPGYSRNRLPAGQWVTIR